MDAASFGHQTRRHSAYVQSAYDLSAISGTAGNPNRWLAGDDRIWKRRGSDPEPASGVYIMLKFIGGTVGIIFLIGLLVVIGLLMLIF
jgi:hypothetical protein